MTIILTGRQDETSKWLHRLQRIINREIDYTGVRNEKGVYTVLIEVGAKKDHPRQRVVRKFIERSEQIRE